MTINIKFTENFPIILFLLILPITGINQVNISYKGTAIKDNNNFNDFTLYSEHYHENTFMIIDYVGIQTTASAKDFKVRIFIEVLVYSNASVSFICKPRELGGVWSPALENFTLGPGESYGPTNFTLIKQTIGNDVPSYIDYDLFIVPSGTNATVHWWYDIMNWGKYVPAIDILATFSILILIAIKTMIVTKKKKR